MIYISYKYEQYELQSIEETIELIQSLQQEDNIDMVELLSKIDISGLSIEAVVELYIELRNSTGEEISIVTIEGDIAL